ncbi:hypothetical protein E2562_032597 [Oryza meyeriana var. granulata]|uniref:Uncharacterized protein n=1 Tax=Oryza meyeriana var. granulata TaxID=110450 RepID=A0A6G1ECP2_9ORYZ|nr:hypothetical protein E2562_032597 [Oryza meyeriana var. granulata]
MARQTARRLDGARAAEDELAPSAKEDNETPTLVVLDCQDAGAEEQFAAEDAGQGQYLEQVMCTI